MLHKKSLSIVVFLNAVMVLLSNTYAVSTFTSTDALAGYYTSGDVFEGFIFTITPTTDTVLAGTAPLLGTTLTSTNPWSDMKFYDSGTAGGSFESTSDAIIQDVDNDNTYEFDEYFAGSTATSPGNGTDISAWSTTPPATVYYYDSNGNGIWESNADSIFIDTDGTTVGGYDAGEPYFGVDPSTLTNPTWATTDPFTNTPLGIYYSDADGTTGWSSGDVVVLNTDESSETTTKIFAQDAVWTGIKPQVGIGSLTSNNPWSDVYFYDDTTTTGWDSTTDAIIQSQDNVYDDGNEEIRSIIVRNQGTATGDDISLELRDGDCSAGTLVGSLSYDSVNGYWSLTLSPYYSFNVQKTFNICVTVLSTATSGRTVQLGVNTGELVLGTGNFPSIDTYNANIQTIDTQSPTVSITQPANGDAFNVDLVDISWTASDDMDTALSYSVDCDGDGVAEGTGLTDANIPYTCDYSLLADGNYNVVVSATDDAGNVGSASISIIIDRTPPTVSITQPADGSYVAGIISIDVNADDGTGVGVSNVSFYISSDGGTTWNYLGTDVDGSNGWSMTLNTSTLSDGSYLLIVEARDNLDNAQNSTQITINVDNTPPVVSIISPTDGSYTNSQTVTISWSYTESNFQQIEVDCNNDGIIETTITTSTTTSYTCDYSSTGLNTGDGVYTAIVMVYDLAGNVGMDSVTFTVDTAPPIISVDAAVVSPRVVKVIINSNEDLSQIDVSTSAGGSYAVLNGTAIADPLLLQRDVSGNIALFVEVNQTPLISDDLVVTVTDLAGNTASGSDTAITDAAEEVFILYAPTTSTDQGWRYLSFIQDVDTTYLPYQKALTDEIDVDGSGAILRYMGDVQGWESASASFGKAGYGYAIKPNYGSRSYVVVPVKYASSTSTSTIQYNAGWNLVSIIPTSDISLSGVDGSAMIVTTKTNINHLSSEIYIAMPEIGNVLVPIKETTSTAISEWNINTGQEIYKVDMPYYVNGAYWVWVEQTRTVPITIPLP